MNRGFGLGCALVVGWAFLGCSGEGADRAAFATPAAVASVVFTSDDAILLTHAGDTATLTASARDDAGRAVVGARLAWSSSAPAVVSVDADGRVQALASVGSAVITASDPSGKLATATIVVAPPAKGTVVVPPDALLDLAEGRATLDPKRLPRPLAAGDVVVAAGKAHLLGRVTQVEAQGPVARITFEPTSLEQAFEEVDIDLTGATASATGRIVDAEGHLAAMDDDDEGGTTIGLDALSCTVDGSLAPLALRGAGIRFKNDWRLHTEYKSSWGRVQKLAVYLEGEARLVANLGTLDIGVNGASVKCAVGLPGLSLPSVNAGPVSFSGGLSPELGVELKAELTGARVEVAGPAFEQTTAYKSGFGYEKNKGVYVIRDNVPNGKLTPPAAHVGLLQTAKLTVGPYLSAKAGVSAELGPFDLAELEFLSAKASVSWETQVARPFDPKDARYRGPSWEANAKVAAKVGVLVDSDVLRVLRRFGIDATIDLVAAEGEAKIKLLESPKPSLRLDAAATGVVASVDVNGGPLSYEGRAVELVGFPRGGGAAVSLGTTRLDHEGHAVLTVPRRAGHDVTVRVWDGLYGLLDLPYASTTPVPMP